MTYWRLAQRAIRVAWIAFLLLVAAAQEIHAVQVRRRRRERDYRKMMAAWEHGSTDGHGRKWL